MAGFGDMAGMMSNSGQSSKEVKKGASHEPSQVDLSESDSGSKRKALAQKIASIGSEKPSL